MASQEDGLLARNSLPRSVPGRSVLWPNCPGRSALQSTHAVACIYNSNFSASPAPGRCMLLHHLRAKSVSMNVAGSPLLFAPLAAGMNLIDYHCAPIVL